MPELVPYLLTFKGGLHLGTGAENLEESLVIIPSDTLFSAVLDAWSRSGNDAQVFAEPFIAEQRDPPFLLTSAFPFAGEVRFYPAPVNLASLFSEVTREHYGKTIKRIRYLSEGILQKAMQGEGLYAYLFPRDEGEEPKNGVALQGGTFWLLTEEVEKLPKEMQRPAGRRHALPLLSVFQVRNVPRVTIDRIQSASQIFHATRVTFAEGCGLWLGVQWNSSERTIGTSQVTYRQALNHCLYMLQEDGLGGERTTGYGSFTLKEGKPFSLPDPKVGKLAYLLSRYHPHSAELPATLNNARTAYQLISVGGWLRSFGNPAQRRKHLTMVAEGSLIVPPTFPLGDLCDVRPTYQNPQGDLPHPVYRMGYALTIGWQRNLGKEADHA